MSHYKHFECTQFKNGNLNLRIPSDELDEFNKDRVFYISNLLWWMNCEFVGETFCLSNYRTGHLIYNSYMDCCYIFDWSDLEALASGKSVKLYARPVSEDDREVIERDI